MNCYDTRKTVNTKNREKGVFECYETRDTPITKYCASCQRIIDSRGFSKSWKVGKKTKYLCNGCGE